MKVNDMMQKHNTVRAIQYNRKTKTIGKKGVESI